MIQHLRSISGFEVPEVCSTLDVSPSGFYAPRYKDQRPRRQQDQILTQVNVPSLRTERGHLRQSTPGRRAFTPSPKSRSLSQEKAEMIGRALLEKTPLIGICRTFKVSPNTVYKLLKNGCISRF